MRILAIDPATKCGWAHTYAVSGVWDLSIRPDESNGMRLIRLRGKLNEIKAIGSLDLVVFEASRNLRHGVAIRVAAQLQGVIELWCTDNRIEYRGYSPGEIKKHATGKGNSGKDLMMAAAKEKWPDIELLDDNHADALWLLDLAASTYA